MASHKKHHYVPRFYLKLFSRDGKSINLLNLPSKRTIIGAPVKNQCYKDYFYGKYLHTENALSIIESKMSRIIHSVVSDCELPNPHSEDFLTFLIHILTQHSRTAYSADMHNEQVEKIVKILMGPKIKEMNWPAADIDNIRITLNNAPQYALHIAAPLFPLIMDLKWKLLRATGRQEFIVSDNPVVFYNQLFSFQKVGGKAGLASKGLEIFFPISPRHLVLLYDDNVYKVGARKTNVINIDNSHDMAQINRLQHVSALENIYFSDKNYPALLEFEKSNRYLRRQKTYTRYVPEKGAEEYQNGLLLSSIEDVQTDLDVSFIKLVRPAKIWLINFLKQKSRPLAVVRDEPLIEAWNQFMKLVERGEYDERDFLAYIRQNNRQIAK